MDCTELMLPDWRSIESIPDSCFISINPKVVITKLYNKYIKKQNTVTFCSIVITDSLAPPFYQKAFLVKLNIHSF